MKNEMGFFRKRFEPKNLEIGKIHWLLVPGCWLFIPGCWSLVADYQVTQSRSACSLIALLYALGSLPSALSTSLWIILWITCE
jgi:hypothetical protein